LSNLLKHFEKFLTIAVDCLLGMQKIVFTIFNYNFN
jgi:hypothetical protein